MLKKIVFLAACFSEIFLFISFAPRNVFAETRVGGDLSGTIIWDSVGSPYILDSEINVASTSVLYIGPGVSISSSQRISAPRINIYGDLVIDGAYDNPVSLSGIDGIWGSAAEIDVKYANINDGNIGGYLSNIRVASSTITNSSSTAFYIWGSNLDAWGNTINNMDSIVFGLTSRGEYIREPDIRISNSILTNSPGGVINEYSGTVAHVENNWWGSAAGPQASTSMTGSVSYSPWLTAKPEFGPGESSCCSSILFIPGLEASRLYLGNNQLWEPNRNKDVTTLYLNEYGSTTNTGIYSGGPIDEALGVKDIYATFMDFLGSLVITGTIGEWKPYGYDWRKPINDVALQPEKKATSSEYLIATVQKLAENSKTKKVTIIAHSNGGIVTKYLVKILEEKGLVSLVDKIISVAVPYIGTPQAISGLLHGDNQSILAGLVLSGTNARELGKNMSSAYTLLPSKNYFTNIFGPTIVFASTSLPGLNDGLYPQEISSAEEQQNFILDSESGRKVPTADDLNTPLVGNKFLMGIANAVRLGLDPYTWPNEIVRWAIVGWNKPTTNAVKYSIKECTKRLRSCTSTIVHENLKTLFGDGTVVAKSADFNSGETISVDMSKISELDNFDGAHANILESKKVQQAIGRLITNGDSSDVRLEINSIPGLTVSDPPYESGFSELVISTHSPVELHVYDEVGRHAGLRARPAPISGNDFVEGAYEEGIPGSSFELSGNKEDYDTFVHVPKNGNKYRVEIKGIDYGSFAFVVEERSNGKTITSDKYMHGPVTPYMIATTTLDGTNVLSIDIDSNGSADFISKPGSNGRHGNATSTEQAQVNVLKDVVHSLQIVLQTLVADHSIRESVARKLDKIKESISISNLEEVSEKVWGEFHGDKHIDLNKSPAYDKQKIVNLIDSFSSRF